MTNDKLTGCVQLHLSYAAQSAMCHLVPHRVQLAEGKEGNLTDLLDHRLGGRVAGWPAGWIAGQIAN